MKKLLTFIALLCTAAVASNEPPVLNITGPSCIAISSYSVKYHVGVGGHLNGDRRGYSWEVIDDDDGVRQDGWIVSGQDEQDVYINILGSCTIYATLYYEEWGTGINKSLHTSYKVTAGTPTFYLEHADSIHNGQFDTTVTGVITRVIHFNIDSDDNGSSHDSYMPDFLVNGQKIFTEDDDILTFRINSEPPQMNVEYIKLNIEAPSHLRVLRIVPGSSSLCFPITVPGETNTIYCGIGNNRGRIFNRNLYLEGMGIGLGSLKIKYVRDNGNATTIANLRYRASADIAGRQEMYSDSGYPFQYARSLSLTGCEFSIYDNSNMSCSSLPSSLNNNNYNAPALAVDRYWLVKGVPFFVDLSGYGTPDNPFEYINGKWYTSYEAFGGSVPFYESTNWYPRLYGGVLLSDAEVINYEGLATALRSFYEPGICPGWRMFYMKLTGLAGWGSDAILHHRGEVLYQYYYDLHSSNNQSNWLPQKYGLELP